MLDRAHQPITIDPNRLLIGIASVNIDSIDAGSLTDASIEIVSTTKERYLGYPANRTETITESIAAQVALTMEEIGSPIVASLLNRLFLDLEADFVTEYAIDMLSPFAGSGSLKLSAKCKMLPELNLLLNDDWSKVLFKFECIGTNAQTLLVKSIDSVNKKASTTTDTKHLGVGLPRVELSGTSIGAIKQVQFSLQGTTKKVESSYPKCTKNLIYVESKFEVTIVTEETDLLPIQDCEISITQALVDGSYIKFNFAHCTILEDFSYTSQNDWGGRVYKVKPFKVENEPIIVVTRG